MSDLKYICAVCSTPYNERRFHQYDKEFCSLKCCREYHQKKLKEKKETEESYYLPTFDTYGGEASF